jgi:hypothetical protein
MYFDNLTLAGLVTVVSITALLVRLYRAGLNDAR